MAPAISCQGSPVFCSKSLTNLNSFSENPSCSYLRPPVSTRNSLDCGLHTTLRSARHNCFSNGRHSLRQDPGRTPNLTRRSEPFNTAHYDAAEDSELTFLERLVKAWSILFPPRLKDLSNAEIARERLRLVLYSDRGEVSPEIRRKLRDNILKAISTYVEIAAEEEIGFSVTTDPDIGTVYSVTVPVRRVKPEYQEHWGEGGFRDRLWTDQGAVAEDEETGYLKARFRLETQILRDDIDGLAG